jgi:hypothetical protein
MHLYSDFVFLIFFFFFWEMLEDTKGIIRSRKSKRTDNAMAKRTNNDLQNIIHKTKDRATRFFKNILLNNNSEL